MEPVVRISNEGHIRVGTLHIGQAEIALGRRLADETMPSHWSISVPRGSFWEPLSWVVNLSVNRSQTNLIPGIVEGVPAGNGEVFLDPIESAEKRPELAARWTQETGIEPGPHPMVLGVSWGKEELLVPLAYLQAIYETLRTQMAPCKPPSAE